MDQAHPIHQTCPHCQANRGYLRAVTFSELVQTLSFRCDGYAEIWAVASEVPIKDRLTLVPRNATPGGMR